MWMSICHARTSPYIKSNKFSPFKRCSVRFPHFANSFTIIFLNSVYENRKLTLHSLHSSWALCDTERVSECMIIVARLNLCHENSFTFPPVGSPMPVDLAFALLFFVVASARATFLPFGSFPVSIINPVVMGLDAAHVSLSLVLCRRLHYLWLHHFG